MSSIILTPSAPGIRCDSADLNPKHAFGKSKPSTHCIPPYAIIMQGMVHQIGADKYGEYNWGDAGVVASVYYDAALRHLLSWWSGEDIDADGLPHLAHVCACMNIVMDCAALGNLEDDRPKRKTTNTSETITNYTVEIHTDAQT